MAKSRPKPESLDNPVAESVLVEPAPAPKAKVQKEESPAKPQVHSNAIPLRVFAAAGGKKWDQIAGFQKYAQKQKLGPMTMVEWNQAYQDFLNRPV